MARERRRGLDQPTVPRRRVPRPAYDPETFGRASERIARTFGTATYLMIQTVFVIVWISYNVVVIKTDKFDPYPFILLNLAFSTQAAYAAPLILLAQNRQADRDRVQYEQDRTRDERSVADMQFLAREVADIRIALGDIATRDFVRSELRDLLDDLLAEPRDSPEPKRAP
jgi:uncharacterized membrane protein